MEEPLLANNSQRFGFQSKSAWIGCCLLLLSVIFIAVGLSLTITLSSCDNISAHCDYVDSWMAVLFVIGGALLIIGGIISYKAMKNGNCRFVIRRGNHLSHKLINRPATRRQNN